MLFFTPASRLPEGCAGVPIFSAAHLAWLFPVLALCVVAMILFSRAKPPARRRVLHGMAAALPALLFGRIALLLLTGGFTPQWYLPLHLCDVMAVVESIAVLRGGTLLRELSFCCGMPAAFCALLTPGETVYPFCNLFYWIFIALHTLLFLMPVLLLFDGLRPRFSRTPKCFLFLLILAAADGICNRVFQSNYLFLREGPAGSILAVLQQAAGPFYILALAALVWCVWGILYGGAAVVSLLQRRRR